MIIALAQLARVVMVAIFVRTFTLQVMEITEFQFLNAIQVLSGDALKIKSINTLTVSIPFHCFRGRWVGRFRTHDLELSWAGLFGRS